MSNSGTLHESLLLSVDLSFQRTRYAVGGLPLIQQSTRMPSSERLFEIHNRPDLVQAWLKDFLNAELISQGHRNIDLYSKELSGKLDDWGIDSLLSTSLASCLYLALDCETSGVLNSIWPASDWQSWLQFTSAALAAPPRQMQFMSSGSAGAPHPHRHTFSWLVREMQEQAGRLGKVERIVSMVPAHHIYGFLYSVILPAVLGVPRIDARALPAPALARHGRSGDLWIAHPFWLQSFLSSGLDIPASTTIISSTQRLPDPWMQELARRGAQGIVEIYGSSETAGIAWRDHPDAFELLNRWSRHDHQTLTDHYSPGRQLALPDRVEWLDQKRFRVIGRVDRIVKIAGERVDLGEVESHIRRFAGVTAARVRQTSGPVPRLKALVAPASLADRVDQLRAHVSQLSAPARPQSWTFSDDWPRSEMGKEMDWE